MSGSRQSQASPCPPGCRFEDAQGYCSYRQIMGSCRSLIEGAKHPGPDCACYEPLEGRQKPRDIPRPAKREAREYVRRPTAKQTFEKDPRVLEMYRAGATDREISEATGWARQTVARWRQQSGLPGNRSHTPIRDREEDAVRLYDRGLSDGAIARELGCSAPAVFRWRERTGRGPNHTTTRPRRSAEG